MPRMPYAPEARFAVERLQNAAKVEIITPEKAIAGEDAIVQVKVTNTGAGHKLPTGVSTLQYGKKST